MYLTTETLRELIAKCLFGKKWEKNLDLVIPRKGNFLNPQYLTKNGTYVVYYIERKDKKLLNFTQTEYREDNAATVHFATMRYEVSLQFIGQKAEEWATSVMFWSERLDAANVFCEYRAQLLASEQSIVAVPFQQEGENGEMSYVASFACVVNATKEEIEEYLTDPIYFDGGLTVEK
jgi:hypothetical protein